MYVGDCGSGFRSNILRDYEKEPFGTLEGQPQRKSYYTMVQGKYLFCFVFETSQKCLKSVRFRQMP